MKLKVLHNVELGKKDIKEITINYLSGLYGILDDQVLARNGNIVEYIPSHHCGGSGTWKKVRKATKQDKELFSLFKKIEEDK